MPVVTDGGRGIGVEALGTNFPFVNPSDDVRGLLADFYLSHAVRTAVLPLRITWLYGFCNAQSSCQSEGSAPSDSPDPVHDADLIVKDSDGTVVFDSTEADTFRSKSWGDRFRLYEWETTEAVCRALVHVGDPDGIRIFDMEIVPENGILDERVSEIVPERVDTITVNGQTLSGEVLLTAGYNIDLTETAPVGRSRRSRNRVLISAAPGNGVGRFPSCEEPEQVIRRINGVGPNPTGDFIMSASACYWLERPVSAQTTTATITPATLRLNNDCGPCCECTDYENTYHGVRRLYDKFKEIGRRAEVVRGMFRENITRWEEQRACRLANPTKVLLAPGPGGYLGVTANYCNNDQDCKFNVELVMTFSHNHGKTGSVVACSTIVSKPTGGTELKELAGTWPSFSNFWEFLSPGRSARILTRLNFPAAAAGDSVTVTVTPFLDGVAQTAVEISAAMYPCGA